jgi:hypothetical protein
MHTRCVDLLRASLLLALMSAPALAQTSNEEKLAEKMAKPFISNAAWETDYAKAKERAAADGKLIFAYFTRSYSP